MTVYNFTIMHRYFIFAAILILTLGMTLVGNTVTASPTATATPTTDKLISEPPPTVSPPSQWNNGAQIYWGMCMDCHGDKGQGLTEEWREQFPVDYRNCWDAGCHGDDYPENSFILPQTVPALNGAGTLKRFSNAFELQRYILTNMPYMRYGSLANQDAWSLATYLLYLNDRQPTGLTLSDVNGAAIPVQHKAVVPKSEVLGTLILVSILVLAALGYNWQIKKGTLHQTERPNFVHHLHPPTVPSEQSRFRYTLGMGGLAVFLSLILLITGLLEMYYYIPTPDQAAISVQTITTLVPYGDLVRNLHYWSAQLLVIVATIHLLRVTLTGAYAPPRRFNYLLGLILLVIFLLLDFTGYVLRWDEGIRWALVVGTNLLRTIPGIGEGVYRFTVGGSQPGTATLIRFYAWHIFGLSLIGIIVVVWHIFRVRRDGGIAVPKPAQRSERDRITRFDLLRREGMAMLIAGIMLLLLSALIPAPIQPPIQDVGTMAGDTRAPWFFLWVQQLLKFGDPFFWGVLAPVLVIVGFGLVPYVLPNAKNEELGRWFPTGNRIAQILTVIVLIVILVLTILESMSG